MKSLSPDLAAHLGSDLSTLAQLVKITRRDGTVLGFTGHDRDLVADGVTYKADSAFAASAVESRSDLSTDNLNIAGMLDAAAIAENDIRAGLYDHARVDVYICNWADLGMGTMQLRRGWIGEVSLEGGQYQAELRGFQDLLQRAIGATFTPECRHQLGDSGCTVNIAALAVSGHVITALDKQNFYDGDRIEAEDYFSNGIVTWTSGANAGLSMDIKKFVAGLFTLWLPMPYNVVDSDGYTVVPGCDKRFFTCRDRFSNLVNFGGFPYLPGVDAILNYPDAN